MYLEEHTRQIENLTKAAKLAQYELSADAKISVEVVSALYEAVAYAHEEAAKTCREISADIRPLVKLDEFDNPIL